MTGPLFATIVSFVRLRFGLYVLCIGMAGILFYLLPLLPGPILKLAFDGLASGPPRAVTASAAALVLVEAARIISLCLSNLAVTNLGYRITNDVRQSVLRRLFANPGEAVSAARWLHRLSTDAEAVSRFVTSTYGPVGQVFALAVAVAVLATVDLRMSAAAVLPVLIVAIGGRALGRWVRRTQATERAASDRVIAWLADVFRGIAAVQRGVPSRVVARLETLSAGRAQAARTATIAQSMLEQLFAAVTYWATAGMALMAATMLSGGGESAGELALFVSYVAWMCRVAAETASFLSQAAATEVALGRLAARGGTRRGTESGEAPGWQGATNDHIRAYVSEEQRSQPGWIAARMQPEFHHGLLGLGPGGVLRPGGEVPTPGGACSPGGELRSLELDGICVSRDGEERLGAVSFIVQRGSLVVVTGRTGAGKSTLIRCLAGFEDVTAGEARWNGRPIAIGGPVCRPPSMAFLLPQPFIFAGSIRDNVLLGRGESEDAQDALRRAQFDPAREGMVRGLATKVGANGSKLSGGQSRRLALARALSRRAQLYVLDEPTSGLDVETERRLMAELCDKDTTAIVASSSPGVLRYADLVVHLSGGTVQAVGSVVELRQRSEEFRHLLQGAPQN